MKVIGIDPGTATYDFVVLEDGKFMEEKTIATNEVKIDPGVIIEFIKNFNPDKVIAPSGYGMPLKEISDLCENDFFRINLKKPVKENNNISNLGLTKVLKLMIENKIPGCIIPGVKHLPSVPDYRKINKIDMGTPDKVCSAALALSYYENYNSASFILAEIGSAFNAFIAVVNGKIIDGIGGTLASSGMMSPGKLDGEIAYFMGDFEKEILFGGGRKSIKNIDKKFRRDYFIEGILKDIAELLTVADTKTIILSGRISKNKEFINEFEYKFSNTKIFSGFEIKRLNNLPGVKKASHSAQGSAIIADGILGGKYEELVEQIELQNAGGSVFDYIYIGNF